MQINAYLRRIRYDGPIAPTAETLRQLHLAHMLAVPFENLDIHRATPIALSLPGLYDKIVLRRRGGFCYELNGLFGWLLDALGFRVTLLSAQVHDSGEWSDDFDHLALLVEVGERWLADVGFGDSFVEPLELAHERAVEQRGSQYKLAQSGTAWELHCCPAGAVWTPQYRFSLTPYQLQDFIPRCHYHQTSPQSHFTQKPVCSLATTRGRITLTPRSFIRTEGTVRDERAIGNDLEYRDILSTEFGI